MWAASEQQAGSGSTAAEGGLAAATLRAVGLLHGCCTAGHTDLSCLEVQQTAHLSPLLCTLQAAVGADGVARQAVPG